MTADITTIVGQLSIKEGNWRNETPNQVAVREPKLTDVPGAGKGDLFIVTEIQGNVDDRDALEQRLAQIIRDSYYLARGSVTASLRRAIQAGNDLLYHRNRKAAVEERIVGGVVILVMCQEDAFVAQIGPAAFFAILGDHIWRYPASSVWLDEAAGPAQDEELSVLGLSKLVEPSLQHLRVDPHDVLVLADSRLAGRLPLNDLVQAVQVEDIKTAVKNLGKAAKAKDGSALVLEIVEAGAGSLRLAAPAKLSGLFGRHRGHSSNGTAIAAPSLDQTQNAAKKNEPQKPEPKRAGQPSAVFASTSTMHKPFVWPGQPTAKTEDEPEVEEADLNEAAVPATPSRERYIARSEIALQPAMINRLASSEEETASHQDFVQDRASGKPSFIARLVGRLVAVPLMLLALAGQSLKGLFSLIPGGNHQEPRQAGRQAQPPASPVPWALLRNIAIGVPLLVALIVTVNYLQKGRLREAEYKQFVDTARSKFEQAQSVDTTAALALMSEAEAALIQAEQIKEEPQPEITELRQQMAAETDKVGNVQRLYYLPQVRQYTDPGTNTQGLVVQGVEIYVLDTGNDRVFHHRLDDSGEALLPDDDTVLVVAKEQSVDSITVGELIGMTWMPTGSSRQTSDLVILNSTGLLEYDPNWGITASALAGGESLKLPVAVASYFGNFYILDSQLNAFLRYLPTVDGYSAPPESYFLPDQPVDLTNAADVAIDGAIYILFKDGRISKFLTGQAVDFTITGLDRPLNRPVAIFTTPDETTQHLYIADAGNQRIVQLNKSGGFVRQFKPRPGEAVTFANLQDIFVDEIGGRLFVLDSNNLYIGKMTTE